MFNPETKPVDATNIDNYSDRLGLHPTELTGFFMNFVMWKFSHPNHSYDPWLKKNYPLWVPDDKEGRVHNALVEITTAGEFTPQMADQRPAIVIQREEFGLTEQLAIKDSFSGPGHFVGSANPGHEATFGNRQQLTLIAGAHRFVAVHTTPEAAERLATDLWLSACDFMHILRSSLEELGKCSVKSMRPMKVGKVVPFEESDTHWACEFSIAYAYSRSVVLQERAPLLKQILITGSTGPIRQVH